MLFRSLELERLARWLEKAAGGELHLVVYCQGNKEKSKMIAEDLRHQLLAVMGKEIMIPIQASWFDEPALIKTAQGSEYELPQGLLVFTRPLTTKRGNA